MRQDIARVFCSRRVDRHAAFVDMLNDAVLIDHERRAISVAAFFVEDAVVFHDRAFEIAEQRKSNTVFCSEFFVSGNAVDADAEICVSVPSNLAISA